MAIKWGGRNQSQTNKLKINEVRETKSKMQDIGEKSFVIGRTKRLTNCREQEFGQLFVVGFGSRSLLATFALPTF